MVSVGKHGLVLCLLSHSDAAVLVWNELVSSTARVFVTGYALPHDRDNEKAYVTVNDKICWTKSFANTAGSQQCGSSSNNWHEDSVAVRCEAESVAGKLTVRVYTNLNGGADDESFAIDNVVVTQISTGTVVRLVLGYSLFLMESCKCSGVTMSSGHIANTQITQTYTPSTYPNRYMKLSPPPYYCLEFLRTPSRSHELAHSCTHVHT